MGSISLWQHQIAAIEAAKHRDNLALFFEQGTGKTATTIKILEQKCEQHAFGAVLPTIILCPQIVIDNWKREILAYSVIPADRIHTLKGPGSKRAANLKALAGANVIVITNYEALNMNLVFEALMNFGARCIIFDESHKLKETKAKRTQRAITLSATASLRYILSGTPVVNSAFDLFSQFLIMDGGRTFGRKFHDFKTKYFYDENAGRPKHCYFPSWVPRTGSLQEINISVNENAVRVKKSECLDLPPLVKQRVEVELADDQGRAYRELEKDMVTFIDDKVVSADLVIKKLLRLQQVSSGFVKMDDGSTKTFAKNPKIEALKELISQIPEGKIIVWAVFKRDFAAIRDAVSQLGIRSVEVHGEVSETQKSHNVADFECRESNARVLIGHPASAGIGINLVSASYAIFFSRSFSLENDLQAEARNYRGGSEIHEKVTRIDIVARGTIDETVLEALEAKENVSETLIQKLRGQNGKHSTTNTK